MKKRLKDMLTTNWRWKIVALIAAVLFWYAYVNMENPVITETVSNVKVEVLNYQAFMDKGQSLEFKDSTLNIDNLTLDVTVKARTTVLEALREKKDDALYVWIDLYELAEGDDRLSIHYDIAPAYAYSFESVQFVNFSNQSYYEVAVEADQTITVPLKYSIIGSPAEGYTYLENDPNIVATPGEINLTGPASELDQVEYAMIKVSVEGAKANVAPSEPIAYYNAEGERVYFSDGSVVASVNAASLYIPIYQVKSLNILPSFTGSPQEGYTYTDNAELSATSVMVYGQEADLKDIRSITLPSISLDAYTGRASETFSITEVLSSLYPEGEVKYYSGSQNIRVSFSVDELLEEDLEVPVSQLTVTGLGDRTLNFTENTVKLKVRGTQQQLDDIDLSTVKGTLSVSELGNGTQTAAVKIQGLTDVTILNEEVTVGLELEE